MAPIKTILVVDDEQMLREAISSYLESKGFRILTAESGAEALAIFDRESVQFVVLDLMLPDLSGEEVCMQLRKTSRVPILMLTAKTAEEDLLNGLHIGADDYLTKPFSLKELYARIEVILRRAGDDLKPLAEKFSWNNGDLRIDFERQEVCKRGCFVSLTPNEWKLLAALTKYPQRVFTREELISIAFGMDFDGYDRVIDTHIKNLRKKIEDDPKNSVYVRTPLANVSAQLETVLEGVWEATTERLQQVENENLNLERAQVDLYTLAQTVAASFDAELAAKGLHCTVTGTAAVVPGDERRLCQVVTNLLSNAVKYTGEGGHIRIRVEDASDRGILIVEDDGIGIPKADLDLVFERFYRTDRSRSRKTGGVGIGLTIVKAIIKAHGGEVSAESREGLGSRFTVVLPK